MVICVTLLTVATLCSYTPWGRVRKLGRIILFVSAFLTGLTTLALLVLPFFARRDSGIGSAILWLVALIPGFTTLLCWYLYAQAVRREEELGQGKKILNISEDDRF